MNAKTHLSQADFDRMYAMGIALNSVATIVELSDPLTPEHKIKVVDTIDQVVSAISDILGSENCPCPKCRMERENEEDSYSPHMN